MDLTPGSRFGVYTVASKLGAGGMGEVYRAHDSRLGRDVALKVLRGDADPDPERLRRFTLEARAVAALNHPNILTIYDVADAGGVPYMATELVEGETLRDRLLRGPVPLAESLEIAVQVARGLAHAHDAHIVHRDLKPANVMTKPDGLVKLLDFGLGKVLEPTPAGDASNAATLTAGPTMAGVIVGTVGYMSPEQIAGRPVDWRSDQFAFGALLYELLTGQRAFTGDTAIETLSSVLSTEPPPLRQLAPATPPAIVAVVERCLAKRPADRYASTRDLLRDLEAIRDEAASGRTSRRPAAPAGRTVVLAGAILVVAVMAGIAALLLMRGPVRQVSQIVVLPFTNIQRDAANDAFADGIAELLTTSLTQLERSNETLSVVPASDVRRYGVASAREARQTFGATLVVSGSIQRSADVMRLTLNLIDSATEQQRSARVIDARADNPLALQDQAFAVLAAMLGSGVEPAVRTALRTGSTLVPGAYDFYVQGRGYLQRYERLDNVDNAIDLFRRAIALDSRFALAHASLGEALWRKYELTKAPSLVADARAACAQAVASGDETAPVLVTLSMIARGTGEYETAVREARRAIELDPAGGDARRELARSYEALGAVDEAEAAYKAAIDARPGDWSTYSALGAFYYARKRNDEALAQFRRVIELTPDNARGYSNIGAIDLLLGRYEESAAMLERSVAIRPTSAGFSNLGTAQFNQGRYGDAARTFEKATELSGGDYRLWRNLAASYYWAPGERARAAAAYQKAAALAEQQRAVNPRQAKLLADLADCYSMLGEAAKARELAGQALAIDGGDPSVMLVVGTAYEQNGDRAAAIDLITRALKAGYEAEAVERAPGLADLRRDGRFLAARR